MTTLYEEVRADQIRPGDRVNRARTRAFFEVATAEVHSTTVLITFTGGWTSRPQCSSIWWRQVN